MDEKEAEARPVMGTIFLVYSPRMRKYTYACSVVVTWLFQDLITIVS